MPASRLAQALTVGVGVTVAVAGWSLTSLVSTTLQADRANELHLVGRQVRAVATGLAVDLGHARAAVAASEGLEAAFAGHWRWLELAPDRPLDPALARLDDELRHQLVVGEQVTLADEADGDHRLRSWTPLPPDGSGRRLVLELSTPLDQLEGLRSRAARQLALGGLAAVLVTMIVTATLGHVLLTRPLRRLQAFVRGVEGGDLSSRLPAQGRGEVVALERALNALSDRLARADRSIAARTREAERAAEDLRRADRLASVGKLAAGVAHELGTPLNVILLRARAITRAPEDAAEVGRNAGIIAGQAERLNRIVRQLLDFSRRRPPHLSSVDPGELCRSVVSLLEPQARAADVSLVADIRDDVPRLRADAPQLEQVLTNLVINALHASQGGGEVVVRCAADRVVPPADRERPNAPPAPGGAPVDVVRVDVIDHGVGISREHLPSLFDPFFTTKAPGEGTGLGLPVAWGIVREHGGWLDVESRECEGARFSVLLPVPPADPTSAQEATTTP